MSLSTVPGRFADFHRYFSTDATASANEGVIFLDQLHSGVSIQSLAASLACAEINALAHQLIHEGGDGSVYSNLFRGFAVDGAEDEKAFAETLIVLGRPANLREFLLCCLYRQSAGSSEGFSTLIEGKVLSFYEMGFGWVLDALPFAEFMKFQQYMATEKRTHLREVESFLVAQSS